MSSIRIHFSRNSSFAEKYVQVSTSQGISGGGTGEKNKNATRNIFIPRWNFLVGFFRKSTHFWCFLASFLICLEIIFSLAVLCENPLVPFRPKGLVWLVLYEFIPDDSTYLPHPNSGFDFPTGNVWVAQNFSSLDQNNGCA